MNSVQPYAAAKPYMGTVGVRLQARARARAHTKFLGALTPPSHPILCRQNHEAYATQGCVFTALARAPAHAPCAR